MWEQYTSNSLLREKTLEPICHARYMPRRTEDLPEEYAVHSHMLAVAIGSRIRQRRRKLRLSQEHVRTRMQLENVYVSRTQFSRIETGEILPNAAEIIALATVLQASCAWVLFGSEEETGGTP